MDRSPSITLYLRISIYLSIYLYTYIYICSRTQMQVSDPGFTLSDDLVQVHEEHVLKEAQAPTGPVAPRD